MEPHIAIALPGFNDLGRSVTPVFLLMDHFLYRFSTFSKTKEENLSIRSLNFLQNAPSNSLRFSSSFIYAAFIFLQVALDYGTIETVLRGASFPFVNSEI